MSIPAIALFLLLLHPSFLLLRALHGAITYYLLNPTRIRKAMEKQGIRGPNPHILLGNIPQISSLLSTTTANDMPSLTHDIVPRLLPHFSLWSKMYGKMFIYWNGVEPRLCLTDISMIRDLLSNNYGVSGRSWQQREGAKHFVGRGLLMANGQDWYHQRHVASPLFMPARIKSYAEYMVVGAERMVERLRVLMGEGDVEIGKEISRLAAEIISHTEFGCGGSDVGMRIFDHLGRLQRLSSQATSNLCIPGSRFIWNKYNREIKAVNKEVEGLLMEIIQSRKECSEKGREEGYGNDLLGMMMNEMQNKDGRGLDLKLIMDECKTFFFAGHETVALLLTWTVMLLASNPKWQDNIREEVKQVCNGATPSFHHLPRLSQLTMVLNEVLRLYPPAVIIPRMVMEDVRLGEVSIPKGLGIWIPVIAMNHSKEIWGDDADEFKPERFAKMTASSCKHFMPFSFGHRNCIGQSFAMVEAKIVLSVLVSRFRFTISDKYRHAPVIVLTVKPKYGVLVTLEHLQS